MVGPPSMEVLWCTSFQVTAFSRWLVAERPTVKTSLCSKAFASSASTLRPSGQSGRNARRLTPAYGSPGLGCSSYDRDAPFRKAPPPRRRGDSFLPAGCRWGCGTG